MNEWMKVIVSVSLSGSLMIGVLLLCKPLYRNRFSKCWQYYIWLAVVARLLIPYGAESSLMSHLFQKADSVPQSFTSGYSQEESPSAAVLEDDRVDILPSDIQPDPSPVTAAATYLWLSISAYLWLIWPVTALVLFMRKVTIYQSFCRYILAGKVEVSDPELLNSFAAACELAGVKKPLELYTHPMISTPLLMGFIRPCVVLPHTNIAAGEFQHIILHEMAHYKCGDIYYKWLVQLALCVHWFNPLVYWMAREAGRACELACDETIIATLNEDGKREYGSTLLGTLQNPGKYKESLASVTLGESAAQLKERLEAIMKFQIPPKRMRCIATVVTVCFCVGGIVSGAYAAEPRIQRQAILPEKPTAASSSSMNTTSTASTARPNITGGSVILDGKQTITSLEFTPTVGSLTVKPGNQYKIEISKALRDHGIYEVKNGTLRYYDNYGNNVNIKDWDTVDYSITITIPKDVTYNRIKMEVNWGKLNVQDLKGGDMNFGGNIGDVKIANVHGTTLGMSFNLGKVQLNNITATGKMTYDGNTGDLKFDTIKAGSLEFNANLGKVTGTTLTVAGDLNYQGNSGDVQIDALSARSAALDMNLGNFTVRNAAVTGTVVYTGNIGNFTFHTLKATSLKSKTNLSAVTVKQGTLTNGLDVTLNSGSADIAGDIKGAIVLRNENIGDMKLVLTNSPRKDYHIQANGNGGDPYLRPSFSVDGKTYPYDYADNNKNAPNTISIISESVLGNDVSIRFQ